MSFLDKPNLILELISKFVKKTVFIASERSSYVGFYNHNSFLFKENFRGFFHSLVDHVLTNSNTQMKWVKTRYPYLKNKTSCIYNGFEICNSKSERIKNNNTRLKLRSRKNLTRKKYYQLILAQLVFTRKQVVAIN